MALAGGLLADPSDDECAAHDAGEPVACAGARAGQAFGAGAARGDQQIDMPEGSLLVPADRPVAKARFARRSVELMQHARQVRAIKDTETKLVAATASAKGANEMVTLIAGVLPGANALLGGAVKRRRFDRTTAKPPDFCALVLAAHIPCRQDLRVGVKRKRLVAAMAKFLQQRQQSALASVLESAKRMGHSASAAGGRPWQAFIYTHQWDESRSYFARNPVYEEIKHKAGFTGQHIEIMVQRGACTFDLSDIAAGVSHQYTEEWLTPHLSIEGTSASAIYPGLVKGLPPCMRFGVAEGSASISLLAESFDVSVFLPLGDRASANLSVMRHLGCAWEELPANSKRKILMLMETCQVHSHHRGKLQVVGLKKHVARHYSICQMYRLPRIQQNLIKHIESVVKKKFERDARAPPPQAAQKTKVFLDTLFHLDKDHHRRSGTNVSAMLQDFQLFLGMANGDPGDRALRHHCLAAPGAKPCCTSLDDAREKYTTALINVLLGPSERLPTESRWTNLLPAMKRTLLRRFLHDINVHKATGSSTDLPESVAMDDEAQASADFFKKINGVREKRAKEYLTDDNTIWELIVHVVSLDVIDDLLYAMLGGAERTHAPAKVHALIDRKESLIAKAQAALLRLLDGLQIWWASETF